MHSLTYVSSAAPDLSADTLLGLLTAWRPKNHQRGLTGMLLYSGGNIVQTLEGPHSSVQDVFASIEADARHRGVIVLYREDVEDRAFPDWSMGFGRYDQAAGLEVDGVSGFLREHSKDPRSGAARHLLETFRDSMR